MQQSGISHQSLHSCHTNLKATMQKLLIILLLIPIISMRSTVSPTNSYQEPPVPTSAVLVHIVGLRSRGGQVCIAVFDSDENFRIEKPLKDKILIRSAHDGDTLTVSLQLPEGMYGISVLDDSNSDSRMNYGFAGIPLEGFGFSGYRQKGLKRPRFSDFSFTHSANTQVEIRMTYLR